MKLLIKDINSIPTPANGYGYAFIDAADNKLKIKKTNSIIEYSNTLDDIQLLDLSDYTAFEVYPHNDLTAGINIQDLGGELLYDVPANMTQSFYIRSEQLQDKQNIVIDWGDGSEFTKLSEYSNSLGGSEGDWRYLVSHTYQEANKKYIIKIFGDTYFGLISNDNTKNIICRCFDVDLPTASHLTNYSSFVRDNELLLNLNMYNAYNFTKNARNISNMFAGCKNLKSVTGFNNSSMRISACQQVFLEGAGKFMNLQNTDFRIPAHLYTANLSLLFAECANLEKDILSLLPSTGFLSGQTITVKGLFRNCKKLTCSNYTKLGEILWNNKNIIWKDTNSCFSQTISGNVSLDLSQIPVSWGGTASDDIIEKSDAEKIIDLQNQINELKSQLQ